MARACQARFYELVDMAEGDDCAVCETEDDVCESWCDGERGDGVRARSGVDASGTEEGW
jgi:hypothetical protein